jgi:hypothetical protein
MTHSQLIIKVEKGEVLDVFVRASIDKTFHKLFKDACRAAKRNPNNTYHGVKVIVFGSFWMEAACNDALREMLHLEIKQEEIAKVLWIKLKGIAISEKIDIFYRLFPDQFFCDQAEFRKRIKKVLDLRNRLAHFKDEPEEANPVRPELIDSLKSDLNLLTQMFDLPELSKALKWEAIQHHAATIQDLHRFLASIEQHLRKKHKLKKPISAASLRAKIARLEGE